MYVGTYYGGLAPADALRLFPTAPKATILFLGYGSCDRTQWLGPSGKWAALREPSVVQAG